ncbi:PlsC domain-containing protein [Aphelenchoides besseyi]|nr:PlsC domain-containing protein [Aphelenchoides besseyi]
MWLSSFLRWFFGPLIGFGFAGIVFLTSIFGNYIVTLFLPMITVFNLHREWREKMDRAITFWMVIPLFFLHYVYGVKVRTSGDRIEYDQPAVVIMNHRTRLDWLYFWLALWRINPWLMTSNKIALKELLKHVPGAENYIRYIYDVTVAYPAEIVQNETDMILKGRLSRNVHYHIRKYDISDLPSDEDGLSRWLLSVWTEKEKRLEQFYAQKAKGKRKFDADGEMNIWCGLYFLLLNYFYIYARYGGIDSLIYTRYEQWANSKRSFVV